MKILIYSPLFYPSVGGIESIISTLAHEFTSLKHEVKLVSLTNDPEGKQFPFEVIRKPKPQKLLELTKWSEIYFQGCISLKGIWPILLVSRPLVLSHHTWYRRSDGSENWQDKIKKIITRLATNISISQAIAQDIPGKSTIIPNAYRDDLFRQIPEINRDKELVFLGRLVSDKGANLLLEAMGKLKTKGLTPQLTVIGSGIELESLQKQAENLNIANQVDFVGVKTGEELVKLLNAHQIMVVPSLWEEPFGIVALEGIACGCVVVGSEKGGLKDAIANCGVTFPNKDVDKLTECLFDLLTHSHKLTEYRNNAPSHLALHTSKVVAEAYLKVFEAAVK